MGPAIRIIWSGGLVPTQTLAPARPIEPYREPSTAWFVVQSNGVAKGIVEGALTVGLGESGEGDTAIVGYRCARDVDGASKATP